MLWLLHVISHSFDRLRQKCAAKSNTTHGLTSSRAFLYVLQRSNQTLHIFPTCHFLSVELLIGVIEPDAMPICTALGLEGKIYQLNVRNFSMIFLSTPGQNKNWSLNDNLVKNAIRYWLDSISTSTSCIGNMFQKPFHVSRHISYRLYFRIIEF